MKLAREIAMGVGLWLGLLGLVFWLTGTSICDREMWLFLLCFGPVDLAIAAVVGKRRKD